MIVLNEDQIKEVLFFLKEAFLSEDSNDYSYEGMWAPALGCYVKDAQDHNKKLRKLIKTLKQSQISYKPAKKREYQGNGIWEAKDGTQMKTKDMSENHLNNAYKMFGATVNDRSKLLLKEFKRRGITPPIDFKPRKERPHSFDPWEDELEEMEMNGLSQWDLF
jgi:hypothetical protein